MKDIIRQLCFSIMLILPAMVNGQDSTRTFTMWVNGACAMCTDRIEETAYRSKGVEKASYDLEKKMLTLKINDKFKEDKMHYRLASVGHDTKKMLAPDAVYNALPACCHYRENDGHDHEDGIHHNSNAMGEEKEDHDHEHETEAELTTSGEPQYVTGTVTESDQQGSTVLQGANVYWSGTTEGVITDVEGRFRIRLNTDAHYLVVSYVGYGKDSAHVHEAMDLDIEFNKALALEEVKVIYRRAATTFDLKNPFNIQELHEKELLKCACCNLSESFETNPAVDVSVTDAVTGTRQIEMLGLAGPYVQITRENMPHIRGLASIYGLTYVPGSWISGIQLNTGTGSVVNGFESITGQINVELKKPAESEKIFLNLFGSRDGMMEANLNLSYVLKNNWSTGTMLHAKYQPFEFDHNGDGFMDHPAVKNGIFLHRWGYRNEEGLNVILGLKGTYAQTNSGQLAFDHNQDAASQSAWGSGLDVKRWEAWMKIGKVFPDKPFTSIGFQLSGNIHDQESFFGLRQYNAFQQSLYSNLIYMSILGNTDHQYRTGFSFQYDQFDELLISTQYLRTEWIPGAFFEYTYNHMDKITVVSGIRADYHNAFGLFFTPRFHVRYAPTEKMVFKAMAGRGQKTANVISENIGMLASSRMIIFEATDNGVSYGFKPEVAWNTGVSFAREFKLAEKEGVAKLDYYYTWFTDQVIANYDRSADAVILQNLIGESYSHSLQAQVNYELFDNYDIRLAYRFNDVKSTIDGELLPEALTPRHRAFMNMAYTTSNEWMFDMTVTWQGMKRLPSTSSNPEEFQLGEYSPDFFLWNAQITKNISEKLEVYIGGENLLNYRQHNPIIDAENPFGDYFDASMIWGPVFGRKVYAGIRVRIA